MFYPEELVEEVRTRNDIVEVVSQYVKMTKKGSNYFGCCPFHNEKTPSFSVSPSRQMYYCFGCGAGGNVITFTMEYGNYTFPEAMKVLADRVGISLPEREATEEEKARASLRSRLLEVNKEAARYYFYQLKSGRGQHALEYFRKRGLSDETIQKFGLGYSLMYRDDLYQYLRKKGYHDELLSQSGLVKITERGVNDRFWNRAMFPIMDAGSRVIGFGGRVMGEGEPKYLNSPETMLFDKSRNLYGLHLARMSRRPYFLICEGYMDVIAMHQAGFDCAVASLGTAFTEGHAMLIRRFVKEVILTYDSDGAGIKAAMRAIPILKKAGISIRVLSMKPYKDPDEFIVHEGAEAFQKRIDEAINSFLFESDVIRERYDMNNPEQKTGFQREIARKLLDFPEELERENYLEAVAGRHGIPAEALRMLVRRMGAALPPEETGYREEEEPAERSDESSDEDRTPKVRYRVPKEKEEGLAEAQRLLLNWAVSSQRRLGSLASYLEPEDFPDPVYRKLAEAIWQYKESDALPEAASFLNLFLTEEDGRSRVAAVFNTVLPEEYNAAEGEKLLAENIRRLKKTSLDRRAREERDPRRLQAIIMQKVEFEHKKIQL